MKNILKYIQFTFKFLASVFYKIGAQHTYNKIFKYSMKYRFFFINYKTLKLIFTNFRYFIELASEIIAVFSLINKVIKVINYIKKNIMK